MMSSFKIAAIHGSEFGTEYIDIKSFALKAKLLYESPISYTIMALCCESDCVILALCCESDCVIMALCCESDCVIMALCCESDCVIMALCCESESVIMAS